MSLNDIVTIAVTILVSNTLQSVITVAAIKTDINWLKRFAAKTEGDLKDIWSVIHSK